MLAACHSLPTPRPKLLVVEDDPDLRTLISAILTASGYRVRSSHDGFSALEEIRTELPDTVLSDLFMTGMSGFELLSVIRRRFPSIRVIAMSGSYSGRDVPAGVAADAFYEKATDIRSLLAMITDVRKNRHTPSKHATSTPIWIPAAMGDQTGEPLALLSCTECLRTFPETLVASASVIDESLCPFCLVPIQSTLVEPSYMEA